MRWMAVLVLALLAIGCSKEKASGPAQQPAEVPAALAPDAATAAIQSIKVDPATVPVGGKATAQVGLDGSAPLELTISWFGPDGWLIAHETKNVPRGTKNVSFAAPGFPQPGTYRAEAVVAGGSPAATVFTVS